MSSLDVAEVTTAAALEALAPEWTALWQRSPTATPFQSPAWLLPWWKHFGRGKLLTITVRYAGALVGLLPLYIFEEPDGRKLLPVGIGISDYLDGVFDEAVADGAATAALAHLAPTADRWDVCDLHQLPPASPLLTAAAPEGLRDEIGPGEPCPVVKLPDSVEELPRRLPRRMAANLRLYRRRAEKSGRVRFERARAETHPTLLDDLLELHGARWGERGLPGVLADEAVRRFHQDAAPALLALGILRLYVLRLDERPIASCYGFISKGRACAYLKGFDPAYARLSPGTLVLGHVLEEAIREGAAECDYLRGREPYKQHWGPEDRPTYHRKLWREAAVPGTFTGRWG